MRFPHIVIRLVHLWPCKTPTSKPSTRPKARLPNVLAVSICAAFGFSNRHLTTSKSRGLRPMNSIESVERLNKLVRRLNPEQFVTVDVDSLVHLLAAWKMLEK